MAQRLATSAEARDRRHDAADRAHRAHGVERCDGRRATGWRSPATTRRRSRLQRDAAEREHTLFARHRAGSGDSARPPRQIKALEDDQKRRAKRSLRDGIDRILVDLSSLFRDVIMLQLGRTDAVINRELGHKLDEAAARSSPAETLATLDAITIARQRIEANVAPLLALEAMLVSFRRP